MSNKIIEFSYQDIETKYGLMDYCELSDVDIRSINHSKIKNYVMNTIYCSDELSDNEKLLFTFIYDLKAQQKYLPGINLNQAKISMILGKSPATISKDLKTLVDFNILIITKDRFGDKIFIPNENINTWGVGVDVDRLSFIEELRKHTASSNKQLTTEYKYYIDMK